MTIIGRFSGGGPLDGNEIKFETEKPPKRYLVPVLDAPAGTLASDAAQLGYKMVDLVYVLAGTSPMSGQNVAFYSFTGWPRFKHRGKGGGRA